MIFIANTRNEIEGCFSALQELRPQLQDKESVVRQIERQKQQGYVLCYVKEGSEVASCMGFRYLEMLAWGKILYIDDLITREIFRKKGFGGILLDYAIETAKREGCREVHLDTGHHRHTAHRLYLNRGFVINCHHLGLVLS